MLVLTYVFILLWIVSLICSLIGLIFWMVALIKKSETKGKRRFTTWSFIASIVFLIAGISSNASENQVVVPKESVAVSAEAVNAEAVTKLNEQIDSALDIIKKDAEVLASWTSAMSKGTANSLDAYNYFKKSQESDRAISDKINQIVAPKGLSDDVRKKIEDAKSDLLNGYSFKQAAGRNAMEALDKNTLKAMSNYQENIDMAGQYISRGVAAMKAAQEKLQ